MTITEGPRNEFIVVDEVLCIAPINVHPSCACWDVLIARNDTSRSCGRKTSAPGNKGAQVRISIALPTTWAAHNAFLRLVLTVCQLVCDAGGGHDGESEEEDSEESAGGESAGGGNEDEDGGEDDGEGETS